MFQLAFLTFQSLPSHQNLFLRVFSGDVYTVLYYTVVLLTPNKLPNESFLGNSFKNSSPKRPQVSIDNLYIEVFLFSFD